MLIILLMTTTQIRIFLFFCSFLLDMITLSKDPLSMVAQSVASLMEVTFLSCTPFLDLLLSFFIGLTLYCAVGIFLNHRKGDRSGIQLIPNYSFWSELPGLCKDGVKFLLNGCKSGYSTIE